MNGLTEQYGNFNGSGSELKIAFPIPFSIVCNSVVLTKINNASGTSNFYSDQWVVRQVTKSNFTVNYFGNGYYIAKGY